MLSSAKPFGTYKPRGLLARLIAASSSCSDTWMGRRLAFILRRFGLLKLKGKPADVKVFGANMRLFPYANLCEKRVLFMPQYFDATERAFLVHYLPPTGVFVDIGANVGAYALFAAAHMGAQGRVLAFEPQPEMFERLLYNIEQNQNLNIEPLNIAVSDRNADMTLFLDKTNSGESSMKHVGIGAKGGDSIIVKGKLLYNVLLEQKIDHIDALKIDIEGAEDIVLVAFFEQAPESLWPKAIVLENSQKSWQTDCIKLLQSHGYTLEGSTKLNSLMVRL